MSSFSVGFERGKWEYCFGVLLAAAVGRMKGLHFHFQLVSVVMANEFP